ncbi:MAG: hypothetical protein GKS06_20220 [Acidobacteria bacterium]|nr:hypothetical protein [Acidobacteriota bacterium]
MQRSREIAAAPERSASETVSTIGDLFRDTLAASTLELDEVESALDTARPALLALVAGGHLDGNALVLVAASLHLSVTTVSGDRAVGLDENLAAVPGAAKAKTWTLYLPTPDPLATIVTAAAKQHDCLSVDVPPDDAKATTQAASSIDLDAFARRKE